MRKLNRKGFTLIELLAVIVILAVVMGIAVTSVLTSMNKARGGATFDTAQVVANGFLQKYTESLVDGAPSAVYKGEDNFGGYDFTKTSSNDVRYVVYPLYANLADTFNISKSTYELAVRTTDKGTVVAPSGSLSTSFVAFNLDTGRFTVCMVVKSTSSNYVSGYAATAATTVGNFKTHGSNTDITGYKLNASTTTPLMAACSDGAQTW